MIAIKKLRRPTRRSGYVLPSGETTEVRGLVIINNNKFAVYIDKFTPKKKRK